MLLALLPLVSVGTYAGEERYDYDPLGRLVRVIDDQGRVTEYVYDAAGNILQVVNAGADSAHPPSVFSVLPPTIRKGDKAPVAIHGSNLEGVSVTTQSQALSVSGLTRSATQLAFTLSVSADAVEGVQSFTIRSAAGTANASITVLPLLPVVNVEPAPLAVPPDGVTRQFTIRLSGADYIDHTIALSVNNTAVELAATSITIPAGSTQAQVGIKGVSAGQSTITMTSATLGPLLPVAVYVTAEFSGVSTSYARGVGVMKGEAPTPEDISVTPVVSMPLGVLRGGGITEISPRVFGQGESTTMAIHGRGLDGAATVTVSPDSGITLGAAMLAGDGQSLSLPITVSDDAVTGIRKVAVRRSDGTAIPAATPGADRIHIARAGPRIGFISPRTGLVGELLTLDIRGENLHEAYAVSMVPSEGIDLSDFPAVNADGSQLTVALQIADAAQVGSRAIVIHTTGGSTSAAATPHNTFEIGNEVLGHYTPVVSVPLGVMRETEPEAATRNTYSSILGVAKGGVGRSVSPAFGIVGTELLLSVTGEGLDAVTGVSLSPSTGATVGTPQIAPDGKSVTVSLAIAPDAPETLRTVVLTTTNGNIAFADPNAALFRVSAPVPVVSLLQPLVLEAGKPAVTLRVKGDNFENATQVRVTPSDDVTVLPPVVNESGTELTVEINAAAGAALGQRVVTVVTPAGESTATPGPTNTLTLVGAIIGETSPIVSIPLGVQKLVVAPPATMMIDPILARPVGVLVSNPQVEVPTTLAPSSLVGVAKGPIGLVVEPAGLAPDTAGTLTITGLRLDEVNAVELNPPAGITVGASITAVDGGQITVAYEVAPDAPAGVREVVLRTPSGVVPFADPAANRIVVGYGIPQFSSIDPILGERGQKIELLIRGSNLRGVTTIRAIPGTGITFSTAHSVNTAGTELTIEFLIAPDAPLGPRVIQLIVPGGASSAEATPANTFNVYQ